MNLPTLGGIEIKITVRCWQCGVSYSFCWDSLGRYPIVKALQKEGWRRMYFGKEMRRWQCPKC